MKKLIFGIIATVSFTMTSCAQTIGIIENNSNKITCDIDVIKKDWEKVLIEQKIPTILTNFEIIFDRIESSGETYYLLLAKNEDSSVKIGRRLELMNNRFAFADFTETVTCSGCSDGCDIKLKDNGQWKCTSCIEGSGCTKTVTKTF